MINISVVGINLRDIGFVNNYHFMPTQSSANDPSNITLSNYSERMR